MPHELINLTLPVVVAQIENVLEDYPESPYQVAFSLPELRHKLIAHVLSHIPNRYTVEGAKLPTKDFKMLYPSAMEERLRMEHLIRGGILHLLRENAQLVSRYIPQVEKSVYEPSY